MSVQASENVLEYALHLGSAPVAGGAELIEVRENGQKVARVDPSREPVFRRRRAEIASESPLVARLQRPHATWQWAQLIAETTWQAAQADAFFSPRITRDAPDRLVGEITARDLYRCFHNDWVARAHIECGARRDLLARLFAAQPHARRHRGLVSSRLAAGRTRGAGLS